MSGAENMEKTILEDVFDSKIPGSSKLKCVSYHVELTPTQLHIFQAERAIDVDGSVSRATSSPSYVKGKQIRSLWRESEEDVRRIEGRGRRSRLYKFYIKRPDGLYKFKINNEERRNMWVQELKTSGGTSDVDLPGTSTAQATLYPEIPSRWQLTDIPSLIYTSDDTPPASLNSERRQPRWLERVKTEDGHGTRHLSLRRQNSTDSDFPRSRSVSLYSSSSRATESGYSSGEFGNTARSRSVSYEDMPDSDHSQTSDDNLLHDSPKASRLSKQELESPKQEDDKLLLSELENLTQHLDDFPEVSRLSVKLLSPVPEESELELSTKSDTSSTTAAPDTSSMEQLQVAYLLKDALEYKVNSEGKTITLMEDLGLMINVPPGAISDTHSSNEVMVRINACIRGPFELPEEYELASPIFHIEPGTKFAEKPVELSMVHYLDLRDEEACSNLKFISAPFKSETGIVKFKLLEGGAFWPDRRVGKVALQHFCLIGIARKSGSTSESEEGAAGTADLPSTVKPVIRNRSKERYIAMLYSPLSFPVQPPRTYHIIFSISLSHPMFIKNLDDQLAEKFPSDSKFWRTSCKVEYAADAIELEIPHETLQEIGYEVITDLGCLIRKESVDEIRRSRLSKSDYVYIDYPPRILMRVQQTSLNQTSSRGQLCPKLKLKGTLKENCFNLPLPVPDTPLLSPQRTQLESQQLPLPSPSLLPPLKRDAQILVSPQKHRSLYSVPDLQELAETVTPNIHHKWHHVGIQMGLQTATLSAIENRHPTDIQRRLNEVFHEWIARSEQSPTWMTLIEILRLNSIGEQKFASELEKSFD